MGEKKVKITQIKLLTKWTLEDNQLYAYGYDKGNDKCNGNDENNHDNLNDDNNDRKYQIHTKEDLKLIKSAMDQLIPILFQLIDSQLDHWSTGGFVVVPRSNPLGVSDIGRLHGIR